jgi:hypothetical protein
MEYSVVDEAGNWECCGLVRYVIDNVPPVVSQFVVPSTLSVRTAIEGSFTVTDNVGLVSAVATLSYGGLVFHSGSEFPLGGAFESTTATATRSFTMDLPARCIMNQPPTAISVSVIDQGKLTASAVRNYGAGQVEGCGSIGNVTFISTGIPITSPSVSRASGTTTLRADVVVPLDNVAAPFSRALFFYSDGTKYWPIGSGAVSVVQDANGRRWYYTLNWDPSDNVPVGSLTVLAVLVDQDGDALSLTTAVSVTP